MERKQCSEPIVSGFNQRCWCKTRRTGDRCGVVRLTTGRESPTTRARVCGAKSVYPLLRARTTPRKDPTGIGSIKSILPIERAHSCC